MEVTERLEILEAKLLRQYELHAEAADTMAAINRRTANLQKLVLVMLDMIGQISPAQIESHAQALGLIAATLDKDEHAFAEFFSRLTERS